LFVIPREDRQAVALALLDINPAEIKQMLSELIEAATDVAVRWERGPISEIEVAEQDVALRTAAFLAIFGVIEP
jgi:hypothetical protein